MSLIPPNNNPELFINDFILYATGHLASVSGIINTVSLYPAAPTPIPGPGVIVWTGYQVSPSTPPTPKLDIEPFTDEQLVISELASLDGLSLSDATSLTLTTDLELDPPSLSLGEVDLLFEQSLDFGPIPEPTQQELEEERSNLGNDDSSDSKDDKNEGEQIPNYKTNIKVPDDVVLAMRRWEVALDDALERAHFLSQCAHESGGWKYKQEIWGPTKAQERYEGRTDLGNLQDGDGFRFRGRGYIQLTGRANYVNAEKTLKGDIVNKPDNVSEKYPADSACYFWTKNKLKNKCKDSSDTTIEAVTKRINGGKNGLADRKKKFLVYWGELQKDPTLWS